MQEGVSAGLTALAEWRAGADVDGHKGGAGRVCWRAVVREMSRDTWGDAVELSVFSPESLAGSALPLPQLMGDDTRTDKAARLLFERARARRPALLSRRVDAIKAQGGRGRRADSVERVGSAARLLLQGVSLDDAAMQAGFTASGTGGHVVRAGDRLVRAIRRLGFRFTFTLRETETREAVRRAAFVPMSPATAASLGANPSATLPLDSGRGSKQWAVAKLALREAKRQAAAARARARAARLAKARAKAGTIARDAARLAKASGLWAGQYFAASPGVFTVGGLARGQRRERFAGRLIVW